MMLCGIACGLMKEDTSSPTVSVHAYLVSAYQFQASLCGGIGPHVPKVKRPNYARLAAREHIMHT